MAPRRATAAVTHVSEGRENLRAGSAPAFLLASAAPLHLLPPLLTASSVSVGQHDSM